MQLETARHTIKAWQWQDILLETHCLSPRCLASVPKHCHDDYQIGLALTDPGKYFYRRASHPVPIGSLTVIHPGETHSCGEIVTGPTPTVFRTMYVPPALLQQAFANVAKRQLNLPFISTAIIQNENLAVHFLNLHTSLGGVASQLEQESLLLFILTQMIMRYAENHPTTPPLPSAPQAVQRVREYLHDHYAQNVSLEVLTQVADLSAFHLCRLFSRELGLPPHKYQIQVRIDHAKKLLVRGTSPEQVAVQTGFYDQSHFGCHFKRVTGVSPGRYKEKSKNFLDANS